jgi:hypothetical protein
MLRLYLIEIILYFVLARRIGESMYSWNAALIYIFICVIVNSLVRHHSIWPVIEDVLKGALLWVILCGLAAAIIL